MKRTLIITLVLLSNLTDIIAQNITYEKRPAQISFVYPIGTSGRMSGAQNFIFSFNLLAGITGEINGFEIAGLGNINKSDAKGFQLAGLWNSTKGEFTGARFSGLLSVAENNNNSFEASGLLNISKSERKGLAMAGLFNLTKADLHGVQLAGLFNNVSNRTSGVQVAGLLNMTKILNGFQLSVINIADTVESGVNIGLLNIIKHGGYSEWELSFSDYQNIGIGFKHGTRSLYNIYQIGVNFMEDNLWSAGVGFGHSQRISDKINFQPEVIASAYFPTDFRDYKRTITYRLKLGLAYSVAKNISISIAPSIYYSDKEKGKETSYGYRFTSIKPFYETSNAENKSELGLGFSVGLIFTNN
jgi:hypothetical protein